jgi:hypothetical protein
LRASLTCGRPRPRRCHRRGSRTHRSDTARSTGEPSSATCGQRSPTRCPRPSTRFCTSWASTTGPRSGACLTSAGRYSVRDRHTAWRATELEDVQLCREAEVRRVIAEIDATRRYPGRHQVQKRLPPGIYMRDGAPGDALAGRGDRSGLARRPLPEAQAGRRPEGRVAAEVSRRAGRRRASRSRDAGGADRDAAAPPRATDAPRRCAGLGYGPGRPRSRLARPPGPTSPDGR